MVAILFALVNIFISDNFFHIFANRQERTGRIMAFEKLYYPLQWSKDEKRFEQDVEGMAESDIDYATLQGRAKYDGFREPPDAMVDCWEDLGLMIALLEDWQAGEFKDVPQKSISRMAGAVAYFSVWIDLVPDTLPGGYVDDAIIVKRVARKVEEDLFRYREWKIRGE
jgi:uncharacterized membrane protein YkvA (DUF1232 family)